MDRNSPPSGGAWCLPQVCAEQRALHQFQPGFALALLHRFVLSNTVLHHAAANAWAGNALYYHPCVHEVVRARSENFIDPSLYMPIKVCMLLCDVAKDWTDAGVPDRVFARTAFMPIDFVTGTPGGAKRQVLEFGVGVNWALLACCAPAAPLAKLRLSWL